MLPFIVITILACIAAGEVCKKEIENIILVNGSDELTSIIIWFPANISTYNTYNICSESTGKRLERTCSKEDGSVKWVDNNKSIKYVNCTQTNKCADETLELFYRNEKNELEKYLNKWLSAEAEEIGFLEKPCYLKTGLLTRKCKYNSNTHKTLWEKSDKEKENLVCWEKEYSEQKQNKMLNKENLFTLSQDVADVKLYKTNPKDAIAKSIKFLKSDEEKRTPTHIDAIRNILKAILDQTETPELVPDILNLTNTLMQTDADVIRDSKCANEIFSTMDSYLNNMAKQLVPTDKCESINDGIYMATVSMASLFFINPLCSNISGMAIFNSDNSSALKRLYDQHSNNYYQFIYLNQSLDKLLAEPGLEVATYLPIDLWNSIISKTGTKNDTILKIMLLKNDVLFVNLTIMKQKPIDSVLEITLIDYKEKLPSALPFIFNNTRNKKNAKPKCGFWNKTTWITTGTNTSYVINSYNEELLLCNTSHLTPFSVLLNLEIMDTFNDSALDMISVLGCSLSLFGLICIWLTAVCFPKWREHSTNKVLLNICFVLTLIMIFFVLLNIPDIKSVIFDINNYMHCLITGAFLQYIVLVLFMWMLFIAVLQYQRFVKVYNTDMGGNFIRKFFIVSWGLPLIPTFLLVRYKPDAYMPNAQSKAENTAICYPSGYGFYLGVMLPITLIIIANVSIFANIILKLLLSNIEFKNQRTRKQKLRQVYLSILLFFLLGISWIFGMLAHLESSPVFSYIFCLTSTLQGFVMFIYFIVINKTTRSIWRNLICGIQNSQQERVL
ncbi:Adhesion G-protein coupled receptor G4 [Lucilia cuprina]|nr:Adhesion G-protein coupled receptor G4 [Lucilia cuprina]